MQNRYSIANKYALRTTAREQICLRINRREQTAYCLKHIERLCWRAFIKGFVSAPPEQST